MTSLTSEQRAVLQSRLTEAEAAYHQLMLGGTAKVFVDQNGERIEFTQTSAARLLAYINALTYQLNPNCAVGPLNVWF